ncbi:MAG: nucleotidyltransferase family protein [Anaerolineae bacterium]|nr:nucleotidyltransferase family protein [Anaerolineae bacterium]
MILAAGEGTRLRPLTDHIPKPMLLVAGKPILEHTLELLARYGISEVVINLHHQPQTIVDHFGDGSRWGVHITYSFESELLGTAGAVKKVREQFDSSFLTLYGDNLTTCDLTRLTVFHRAKGGIATIALHYRDDPTASGIATLDDRDRITRFVEKPKSHQVFSHWVSAGLLVLEPEVLDVIPEGGPSDLGRDLFPSLLARGEATYGYRMSQGEYLWWIDTPEDLQRVKAIWEERRVR